MITYEIKSRELDALISNLQSATKQTASIIESALDKAGYKLLDIVKAEEPIRTGNLRRTTFMFSPKGTRIIRPGANYAIYVHEGTRYIKPNKFLPRAGKRAEPEIDRILKAAADSIINQI